MGEFAVRRTQEVVDRPILVEEPRDLVWMAHEVGRELRRDDRIDRQAIRLSEIDETPRRRLRQELALRVPLEGQRHLFGSIAVASELLDEASNMELRAAVDERHLRLAD
jgi:hypothetical protein